MSTERSSSTSMTSSAGRRREDKEESSSSSSLESFHFFELSLVNVAASKELFSPRKESSSSMLFVICVSPLVTFWSKRSSNEMSRTKSGDSRGRLCVESSMLLSPLPEFSSTASFHGRLPAMLLLLLLLLLFVDRGVMVVDVTTDSLGLKCITIPLPTKSQTRLRPSCLGKIRLVPCKTK